jgi:hypothetical protein
MQEGIQHVSKRYKRASLCLLGQVKPDILQRVLGTFFLSAIGPGVTYNATTHCLFVYPRSFTSATLNIPLINDLEINWKTTKGYKAQIPGSKEYIQEPMT